MFTDSGYSEVRTTKHLFAVDSWYNPNKHIIMQCVIFAAIGNAFAVLSDTQKRKRYDEYGVDGPELRRRSHTNGYEYDFSRGFEGKHCFCVL